jgi:outer membrane protein OmpA-like peptidoglycan-associated protein
MAEPVRDNRLVWGIVAVAVVLLVALFWVWGLGNTLTGVDTRSKDLEARFADIPSGDAITALEQKQADLEAKLAALQLPDLAPVQQKVDALEARLGELATATAVTTLETRQADLEAKLAALQLPDLAPVQQQLDALKTDLTALQTRVSDFAVPGLDELVARLAAVEAAVAGVQPAPDQSALTTEVADLKTALQALQTQVGDFAPAQLADLSARLDTLSQQVATLGGGDTITTPAVDLGTIDTRISDLETRIAAIVLPDVAPLGARIDTVAADVDTLKTTIAGAATTEQVGLLENRVADLGTQVTSSSAGLETVRTDAAALTSRIGELDAALAGKAGSAEVTSLSGELDALKQQVAALPATDAATFETSVAALRTDLDALASRVAALPATDDVLAQLRTELATLKDNPPPARPPVVLERIYFGPSSTGVSDEERGKLPAIAQRLNGAPGSLSLVGFSDSQGPAELNRSLSLRRAAAVRLALLDAGVDPAAVTSVTGLGEDAPPVASGDDADEAGNRVVLIYGH